MQTFFRLIWFFGILTTAFAGAARELGPIDIELDRQTIPVRVSSSDAALQQLAQQAFDVHGLYRRTGENFRYDIVFTSAGPASVRVDVRQGAGGPSVVSRVLEGTGSTDALRRRNALLRAADLAVERTNGLGLRGFFTSRLAFIGELTGRTEIYTTEDLFFGGTQQLTQRRSNTLFPRWSPDGTRISFTSYFKSGAPDAFIVDLRTNQILEAAAYRGMNLAGPFSPDGQRMVLALSGTGVSQIYVADANGRNAKQLTFDREWESTSPVFSPDGSQILFSARPGPRLYLVPVGGGAPRAVNTGFSHNAEADWSRADPNKIAFTIRVGGRFQIGVYDFSTGRGRQVTEAPYDAQQAVWLPDGRHIVCTFSTATRSELWVVDTVSGSASALSRLAGFNGKASQASVLAR